MKEPSPTPMLDLGIFIASVFIILIISIIQRIRPYFYSINNGKNIFKKKIETNGSTSDSVIDQNTSDVIISTEEGYAVKGKFICQANSKDCKTIIYFLPYKGSYEECEPHIHELWNKLGVNIAVFNYRDIKETTNNVNCMSEEKFKSDSQIELNSVYLNQYINNSEIYLYGRSLGGAIALYLGSTQKKYIKGLIVENTFTSNRDLVAHAFKLGSLCKWSVSKSRWNSEELIKTIDLPILFISGRKDQAIPPAQMDRLYNSAKESKHKDMFKVEDGSHKDTWEKARDDYFERISDFMEYEYI